MANAKKPPKKTPPPAPTKQAPANDAAPDLEPLFDNPELGTLVPRDAIIGGGIEVYRYKRNAAGDAVGIPSFTLKLPPGATIEDILANRQGGAYLARAKNAMGVVVGAARHNIEGPELEPAPSGGARQPGKVDSVQSGVGFRLAIEGLNPQQQQLWLMQQDMQRERQEYAEKARAAEAERHTREMARVEKFTETTLNLMVTAFTKRPSDEGAALSADLRAALRDAHKREEDVRLKLLELQREAAELNVEVNDKGEISGKDLLMGLIENAGEVGAFLQSIGWKPKGKGGKVAVQVARKVLTGKSDGGEGDGGTANGEG